MASSCINMHLWTHIERSLPYIMETTIKQIEDMSLNAWPSHKMELYDGWILRFSTQNQ